MQSHTHTHLSRHVTSSNPTEPAEHFAVRSIVSDAAASKIVHVPIEAYAVYLSICLSAYAKEGKKYA